MPTMFGNSGCLFGFAIEARDRTRRVIEAQPGATPGDAVVAVIMSVVAAEGFINELSESALLFDSSPNLFVDDQGHEKLTAVGRLLSKIEEEHGSLQLKYHIASFALSRSTFDPGKNPFQDFDTLVGLRNLFVHFRPRDKFQCDDQGLITANEHPKLVRTLQQRGIARRPNPNSIETWSSTIMTAEVADWACTTVLQMIRSLIYLIPPSFTRAFFSCFETMQL
jgi:hypothetical protein